MPYILIDPNAGKIRVESIFAYSRIKDKDRIPLHKKYEIKLNKIISTSNFSVDFIEVKAPDFADKNRFVICQGEEGGTVIHCEIPQTDRSWVFKDSTVRASTIKDDSYISSNSMIDGCLVMGSNVSGSRLKGCTIINSQITNCNLEGCTVENSHVTGRKSKGGMFYKVPVIKDRVMVVTNKWQIVYYNNIIDGVQIERFHSDDECREETVKKVIQKCRELSNEYQVVYADDKISNVVYRFNKLTQKHAIWTE